MNIAHLTPLENAVIEAIVQGQPQSERCLRVQLQGSQLRSRENNGYGFFTNFLVPEHLPKCPDLGILHASALVNNESCGFMLWIKDGRIDFFEGFPLGGDSWPQHESFTSIRLSKS